MKTRYRLIRRGVRNGAFYCVDTKIGKRTSLRTGSEDEARQIVDAKNQALRQPVLNMQIAKAYHFGKVNEQRHRRFCCNAIEWMFFSYDREVSKIPTPLLKQINTQLYESVNGEAKTAMAIKEKL